MVFAVLFMVGGGKATTTVGDVLAGTPAAQAGLHPGDKILAIDGTPVRPQDIPRIISSSQGQPLTVRVERDRPDCHDRARCTRRRRPASTASVSS